jgi:hypothetical protein
VATSSKFLFSSRHISNIFVGSRDAKFLQTGHLVTFIAQIFPLLLKPITELGDRDEYVGEEPELDEGFGPGDLTLWIN